MVDITPLIGENQQLIQSYSAGRFRISGAVHEGAVIVFTDRTLGWNAAAPLSALNEESFAPLYPAAGELDVVLLGSGKTGDMLAPALRKALKARGLNVDVMDTGAACRTYNVLMAEGRRVAAALLPV